MDSALLDDLDREIVKRLQLDGRMTYLRLGETLKISDSAARRRVQRLLDDDTISIVAVTDPARIGIAHQTMLAITVSGDARAVAAEIGQLHDLVYLVFTSGRHDLVAEIVCTSATHELETVNTIRSVAGIDRVETIPYMQIVKQEFAWGTGRAPGPSPIDAIDREIIKHLQTDGRMPYSQLGELVGLSDAATGQRVRTLTDRGIISIVAVTDPATIGLGFQGLVGITASGDSRELAAAIADWPDAAYVVITAGRYDLIVELLCADVHAFVDLVNEIRVLDAVASAEAMTYLRTAKQTYDWGVG